MALKNVRQSDNGWFEVGHFDDNDGHMMTVSQTILYPWAMLEVYPCPACAAATPYVVTFEQMIKIIETAFPFEWRSFRKEAE